MDLCQPCLETERAQSGEEIQKMGKEGRERREYGGDRHDTGEGLEIYSGDKGDGWIHREGESEKDKRFIYCSLGAVCLFLPYSL